MSNFNSQKIIAPIMRFVNMKGIIALKDGMLAILPLTVVGSLFLIIGQLPFEGLNQAIASIWRYMDRAIYAGLFRNIRHHGINFLLLHWLFIC